MDIRKRQEGLMAQRPSAATRRAKAASAAPAEGEPSHRPIRLRPEPIDSEKYPNLAAHRDLERALRIHRAMAAGMSRDEAKRHADEHLSGRAPRRGKVAEIAKPPRKAVAAATKRFHKSAPPAPKAHPRLR